MSKMFGGGAPAPQPVPVAPTQNADDTAAREAAARQAIVDRQMTGRRSTLAAGGEQAEQEQYQRGLLKSKQRTSAAASGILG